MGETLGDDIEKQFLRRIGSDRYTDRKPRAVSTAPSVPAAANTPTTVNAYDIVRAEVMVNLHRLTGIGEVLAAERQRFAEEVFVSLYNTHRFPADGDPRLTGLNFDNTPGSIRQVRQWITEISTGESSRRGAVKQEIARLDRAAKRSKGNGCEAGADRLQDKVLTGQVTKRTAEGIMVTARDGEKSIACYVAADTHSGVPCNPSDIVEVALLAQSKHGGQHRLDARLVRVIPSKEQPVARLKFIQRGAPKPAEEAAQEVA